MIKKLFYVIDVILLVPVFLFLWLDLVSCTQQVHHFLRLQDLCPSDLCHLA